MPRVGSRIEINAGGKVEGRLWPRWTVESGEVRQGRKGEKVRCVHLR